MIFDPMYLLFLAPGLLLSMWASYKVQSAFNRYSQIRAMSGMSGAEAAQQLLSQAGIRDVAIEPAHGMLSDHYDPSRRTLALSETVYAARSVAAIGVAAHEAGHAIQHANKYAPLALRSAIVPMASIGSSLGYIVMTIGIFMSAMNLFLVGVVLFSAVILFQLITLPVEFDASRRAKELILKYGIVSPQEREGVDKVLNAAALTYVAAAITTLLTLLYFLFRAGLLGGRRDEE